MGFIKKKNHVIFAFMCGVVWFILEAIIEKGKKKLWLLFFAIYFAKNERISIMWSPCEMGKVVFHVF